MQTIRIGLTNTGPSPLLHKECYVDTRGSLYISCFLASRKQLEDDELGQPFSTAVVNQECLIRAKNKILTIQDNSGRTYFSNFEHKNNPYGLFYVAIIKAHDSTLFIKESTSKLAKHYTGQLMIVADQNNIRLLLYQTLENYVQSVLHGEIPESYHIEAIKAQAICARTYALNPRINHQRDFCNVCDSYLCCQCFVEKSFKINSPYQLAVSETTGLILTHESKPALALFSSCAGGHTENYEDCFSSLASQLFPPQPIPYLRGVSETLKEERMGQTLTESLLREIWFRQREQTCDEWSKNFRWSLKFSKQDLESNIHSNLSSLFEKREFAPFIIPPPSGVFGEILSMSITKRGVGGVAIILRIETSKGHWEIKKELVIRSLFKNQNLNLKRLASGKIFFDHIKDSDDQLLSLHIYGLGSGHGVGLQQVGAEGLARVGKNYQDIISHYYKSIKIEKV